MSIAKKQWVILQGQNDSRFIRDLSGLMWTEEQMQDRCLDPKRAKPIEGHPPRKECTPKKLNAVISMYNERLKIYHFKNYLKYFEKFSVEYLRNINNILNIIVKNCFAFQNVSWKLV